MVLAFNPLNVAVVVLPVMVAPPGLAVTVQLLAGRLLSATLPVGTAQVGCVMVPIVGGGDVVGCVLTTAFADEADTQPDALVTVNV